MTKMTLVILAVCLLAVSMTAQARQGGRKLRLRKLKLAQTGNPLEGLVGTGTFSSGAKKNKGARFGGNKLKLPTLSDSGSDVETFDLEGLVGTGNFNQGTPSGSGANFGGVGGK